VTARRARALALVPDTAVEPDPEPAVTVPFAEAFELGRRAERDARADGGFAAGLRLGISLFARIAAGDEVLAEQLRRLVDEPVTTPKRRS
jgi:hypothetical protein